MDTKREEGPGCSTAERGTLPERPRGSVMIKVPLWLRNRWIEILIGSLLIAMSGPLMRLG